MLTQAEPDFFVQEQALREAKGGSFLDIGCARGLLMESVVAWAREDGHGVSVLEA
jgi:2-polyprenyl-3-methyl-5-hydroxy-6-metoxy-1,4-benzoquinol methylase